MTHVFEDNMRIPVTRLVLGPCVVTQVKTSEKQGYNALQLGFGEKKITSITKPQKGHLKGAIKDTKKAPLFLSEVHTDSVDGVKVGDTISITDVFAKGDTVTVSGTSKGKGFAGVIKRWNFKGFPATHGHDGKRIPGSIGQGTTPGRVRKGKKMPGRMGHDAMTITGLTVVKVDPENNEIWVSGSVPGARGSFVKVKRTSPKQEVQEEVAENVETPEEAPVVEEVVEQAEPEVVEEPKAEETTETDTKTEE